MVMQQKYKLADQLSSEHVVIKDTSVKSICLGCQCWQHSMVSGHQRGPKISKYLPGLLRTSDLRILLQMPCLKWTSLSIEWSCVVALSEFLDGVIQLPKSGTSKSNSKMARLRELIGTMAKRKVLTKDSDEKTEVEMEGATCDHCWQQSHLNCGCDSAVVVTFWVESIMNT
jgi:hypothetical protein